MPREALVKKHEDEDERFTFRKAEPRLPRSQLQEELGATILRLAKERFRRRGWNLSAQADATEVELSEDPASLPSSPPMPDHAGSDDQDGEMQMDRDSGPPEDDGQPAPAKRARRESPQTYEPVVSTNDEESYELLDVCVRHIVAQLDRALTILHNTRVAGVSQLSDSSTDSDSDSQASRRRSRGRPRRTPQPGDSSDALSSPGNPGGPRRRGRPRKPRMPREGETEDEFRVRIAREGHRRIPWTQQDKDAAFEEWLREGDERMAAGRAGDESAAAASEGDKSEVLDETATDGDGEDGDGDNVEAKLRRWGLRDWGDVLGAAGMAGFPAGVIKRTARRCARLLGEGIVMRRLDEIPASRALDQPTPEVAYRPEPIRDPFTSSWPATSRSSTASTCGDSDADDSDDAAALTLQQRRLASLASSPSPRRGRRRRGSESSASRSRSRSSAGLAFCPVASCERAATGFARRVNLRRHLHLVHPGRAADADADSDDEVLGAVHVDGFLRPIAVARGWRGETVRRRDLPRRGDRRGRDDGHGAGVAGGEHCHDGHGDADSDGGGETADDSS